MGLDIRGILCNWAFLDIAGIFCGWALRGYLVVEHCRDTLQLGTTGIFGGWALQGYFGG